jgi:hypothetical protein
MRDCCTVGQEDKNRVGFKRSAGLFESPSKKPHLRPKFSISMLASVVRLVDNLYYVLV